MTHTPESYRTDLLDVAREELERGVVEDIASNIDSGGRIALYSTAVDNTLYTMKEGDPYCMSFVSWVCERAGIPIIHKSGKGLSYVPHLWDMAWEHDATYEDESRLFRQLGDLVVFQSSTRPNHVAFVEAFTEPVSGDLAQIQTIEGNVGSYPNGGVKSRILDLDRDDILGFVDIWKLVSFR